MSGPRVISHSRRDAPKRPGGPLQARLPVCRGVSLHQTRLSSRKIQRKKYDGEQGRDGGPGRFFGVKKDPSLRCRSLDRIVVVSPVVVPRDRPQATLPRLSFPSTHLFNSAKHPIDFMPPPAHNDDGVHPLPGRRRPRPNRGSAPVALLDNPWPATDASTTDGTAVRFQGLQ